MHLNLIGSGNPNKVYLILRLPGQGQLLQDRGLQSTCRRSASSLPPQRCAGFPPPSPSRPRRRTRSHQAPAPPLTAHRQTPSHSSNPSPPFPREPSLAFSISIRCTPTAACICPPLSHPDYQWAFTPTLLWDTDCTASHRAPPSLCPPPRQRDCATPLSRGRVRFPTP